MERKIKVIAIEDGANLKTNGVLAGSPFYFATKARMATFASDTSAPPELERSNRFKRDCALAFRFNRLNY